VVSDRHTALDLRLRLRELQIRFWLEELEDTGELPILFLPASCVDVVAAINQLGGEGPIQLEKIDDLDVSALLPVMANGVGDILEDCLIVGIVGARGSRLQMLNEVRLTVERFRMGEALLTARWASGVRRGRWARHYFIRLLLDLGSRWPTLYEQIPEPQSKKSSEKAGTVKDDDAPWLAIPEGWAREAVRLWWGGYSKPEIAAQLDNGDISPKTVENRFSDLRRLYGKAVVPLKAAVNANLAKV
jgi:hypothetical protein